MTILPWFASDEWVMAKLIALVPLNECCPIERRWLSPRMSTAGITISSSLSDPWKIS